MNDNSVLMLRVLVLVECLRCASDSLVPISVLDAVSRGFVIRRRRGTHILMPALEIQIADVRHTPC